MSIGKSIVIINIFLIERLVTISTRNLFTDTNLNMEFTKNTIKHIENTEIEKKIYYFKGDAVQLIYSNSISLRSR